MAGCHFTMQEGRLVIAELRCFPYDPRRLVIKTERRRGAGPPVTRRAPLPQYPWQGWRGSPVPAGGLTKRWLTRAVAIGDHVRAADGAVRAAQSLERDSTERAQAEFMLGSMLDTPLSPRAHPRGRGRPPLDEALLLRVAVEYARALQTKDLRRVNHVVATRLKLTPTRVRMLVHQARNKCGFLTRAHQGVPGGQLTPVALARLPRQPKGTRLKPGGRRQQR